MTGHRRRSAGVDVRWICSRKCSHAAAACRSGQCADGTLQAHVMQHAYHASGALTCTGRLESIDTSRHRRRGHRDVHRLAQVPALPRQDTPAQAEPRRNHNESELCVFAWASIGWLTGTHWPSLYSTESRFLPTQVTHGDAACPQGLYRRS